jgi:disintegrin and metalloproteinase domain-containing protein 10
LKSLLYSGYDVDDPSVRVTGHLAFGLFDGVIHTPEETYYIEPSFRYTFNSSNTKSHTIIYRQSDINTSVFNTPHTTTCGATTKDQQRKLLLLQQSLDTNAVEKSIPHIQKRQVSARNTSLVRCNLKVVADYKFVMALTTGPSDNDRMTQAIGILRNIITTGSNIFAKTDFDGNGPADNIHFVVLEFVINVTAPDSNSPFANDFIGVEAFLNAHSENNYNDFCLSYLFTYRDFDGGVLGLAFVASTTGRGGLCDNFSGGRTLNTGIVTMLNYNSRVPIAVTGLTFTHEAGHNFGSQHDPPNNAQCSPSDANGGKYVMFASANTGALSNNNEFSSCSIASMNTIISSRGQRSGCFVAADDNCRNQLIDDGEDCDCGRNYNNNGICNNDKCCNGTSCKILANVQCSPQQGPCCNSSCMFVTSEDDTVCVDETECSFNQTCNGTTAICPMAVPKGVQGNDTAIPCNNGSNFCTNGACLGSICIPLGLSDCECNETSLQCHVCCLLRSGTCNSTVHIADTNATARSLLPGNRGQVSIPGSPCNDFNGYCDFFETCRPVLSDSAITRISDFFNSEGVQNFIMSLQMYWWAAVIVAVVIIIVLFLIVLACHCLLPRPEHMKKRSERRKSIRQSQRRRRIVNQDIHMSGYPETDSHAMAAGYVPPQVRSGAYPPNTQPGYQPYY